jgi:hypothetical protein
MVMVHLLMIATRPIDSSVHSLPVFVVVNYHRPDVLAPEGQAGVLWRAVTALSAGMMSLLVMPTIAMAARRTVVLEIRGAVGSATLSLSAPVGLSRKLTDQLAAKLRDSGIKVRMRCGI